MAGNVRGNATTPEKNYQVKTKEGDKQSSYLENKLIGSTYVTLTEEEGTYDKRLKIEVDAGAIGAGVLDWKVAVDSGDVATPGYLEDKLIEGDGTVSVTNNGTEIEVELDADLDDLNDVTVAAVADDDLLRYDFASSQWTNDVALESTHTGATDKVPTARSLSNLLQGLVVNTNEDFAEGYESVANMYRTIDMDVSRIMYVTKAATTLVDSYPDPADLIGTEAVFVTGVDPDRDVFGQVGIKTKEDGAGSDYFMAALMQFTLNEDYMEASAGVGSTIYLDVMFKLADSSNVAWETQVRAFPYYVKDADTARTALSTVDNVISWTINGTDLYEWHSFAITGPSASTTPTPIAIFLACLSEDGTTYDDTPINNATICGARVRYKKQTLQLRTADVSL